MRWVYTSSFEPGIHGPPELFCPWSYLRFTFIDRGPVTGLRIEQFCAVLDQDSWLTERFRGSLFWVELDLHLTFPL